MKVNVNYVKIIGFTLFVIIVFLFAMFVYIYKTRPKLAYVRSLELVYQYNGMKEAHESFMMKTKLWQMNIDTLQRRYENQQVKLKKIKKTGNAKLIQEMELLVTRMEHDLKKYTLAIQDQIKDEEQQLTQAVLNQVNSSIEQYGKEHGYDMILGSEGTGTILYGSHAYDITEDILAILNKAYPKLNNNSKP